MKSLAKLLSVALVSVAPADAQVLVPTRPTEILPLVQVEIKKTATQRDDYVGSDFVECRLRLAGPHATNVPVTIRNMTGAGGMVAFREKHSWIPFLSSPTVSRLNVNLPASGAWKAFWIARKRVSNVDKDAAVEVVERRPDGIVLARKPFATTGGSVAALTGTPRLEISIGEASTTLDDYVTWSPTTFMVRQSVAAAATLKVIVRNMAGSDRLRFASHQDPWPAGTTATQPNVEVTIPALGAPARIAVAGHFENPSTRDKDAVLEIVDATAGKVLAREGLMVRVRKNANKLTAHERTTFLRALGRLNVEADGYDRLQHMHFLGGREAHGLNAFLPWHRVFLLDYERMLQALDPAVALPYWKFDEPAPNVFHANFMGTTPSGSSTVSFESSNPLSLWRVEDDASPPGLITGVIRQPEYNASAVAPALADELTTLAMGSDDPAVPATYDNFMQMEGDPHGWAHVLTGGRDCPWCACIGVLCDPAISVRDPVFFLLHTNVDRLWAKWQRTENRFDHAIVEAYTPQTDPGTSPSACRGHRSWVAGTMWPWSGVTSLTDPCRPTQVVGGPLVVTLASPNSPPAQPRPRDVIDYRFSPSTPHGTGFAYDDVRHP
jgi:tyrosinase